MRVSVKPWLRPYVQQIAADLGCGEDFTEALAQIIIEHREFRRGASVTQVTQAFTSQNTPVNDSDLLEGIV